MSALDRLLDRTINRDEYAVKKKKREKRNKVASLKKLKQKAAPEQHKKKKKNSEYSWSDKSEELVELQNKVLQMKKEQHSERSSNKTTKKKSEGESKYAGFDTIGLTPGLAPVGYEESDSDED
ncbi:hypothetical protein TRVA0_024S01904 [Trichomonascus vanleenenianus]|uniref:Rrt14p n=1 Tax=Trichomonascus vanleenenianus TaxID=2268995 RepID=UPI003EC9ADAD